MIYRKKFNVFAKILRGEIPSNRIFENDYVISIFDINPKAATHALVITKNAYTDFNDFMDNADKEEITEVLAAIKSVAQQLDLIDAGYRVITNVGKGSGQEVPHLHFHILSNKKAS